MSFDTLLAKSPSIIYKPGGVNGGLVVTTWTQVQEFIAYREGAVIVYVDDSIVSPALVPGASGLTDCEGRVEFRPHIVDSINFAVLQVEPGATLRDVYQVTGMELRCNPQNATPSLDFTSTSGGNIYVREFGLISNAATATQPGIIVAAGKFIVVNLEEGSFGLNVAVPLVSVAAGGTFEVFAVSGSFMSPGIVSGAGNFTLSYDETSGTVFGPGIPAMPGLTGTYQAQLLDPNAIIYKPGIAASFGRTVATWAEVQKFIANLQATGVVYVDDSIVSPALVPGATGITDCQGRVELRPFAVDAVLFSVLQIENGAQLLNLYKVSALDLRSNNQGALPSLDWNLTPTGGGFYLDEFAQLSNAATATGPMISVAAGVEVFISALQCSFLLNAPAVPLFSVAAVTSTLGMLALDAAFPTGLVSGPGTFSVGYDNVTASGFAVPGTPPAQPGVGTYSHTNLDDIWVTKPLDPVTMGAPNVNDVPHFDGTKWVAGPVPSTSTLSEQTINASGAFVPGTVDVLVFVDTTGGPVNLTLPAPVAGVATRYTFKDSKQNFNVNALTLVPPGAVLIEGANVNFPISAQGAHVTVISDGVNYFV